MGQKLRGGKMDLYTFSLISRSVTSSSIPSHAELEEILKLPSPQKEHTLVRRLCAGCATLRKLKTHERSIIQIT
jgi:hypothetical protein